MRYSWVHARFQRRRLVRAPSMTGISYRVANAHARLFPFQAGESRVRPFLKWAGGKTRLLAALRRSMPVRPFKRYFEPFMGGGAFFFDLAPGSAVLSDSNAELINCYKVVRDSPEELIRALLKLRVSERRFYELRALDPANLTGLDRAARLTYLNKTCFNGLYRVNKLGQFNTPYGRRENVSLTDVANLRAASTLLQRAKLRCVDYEVVLESAEAGDFVYLDPPYLPVGKYSDFNRYTKESFYEADHEKLAHVFDELDSKGCYVLLSNSFHKKIAALYSRYNQRTVKMPRFVNCRGEGRGSVDELLISNYNLPQNDA
jgi:DNA adenine methylase